MLLAIIIFLLTLSFLVIAHELGHFWLAKKAGIPVEEFGIGFPPRLWAIKKGETEYSINTIFLGGFVRLTGENGDNDSPNAFYKKAKRWRALVLFGGVAMNILVAYLIFVVGLTVGMPVAADAGNQQVQKLENVSVEVYSIIKDSPASIAGVLPGDKILSINNKEIKTIVEVSEIIKNTPDRQKAKIVLGRGDTKRQIDLEPQVINGYSEQKAIGVGLTMVGRLRMNFFAALVKAAEVVYNTSAMIITTLCHIIINLFMGRPNNIDVSGPIGVAVMTTQASKLGLGHFIQFVAMLSINLAIINILPFPALDGGRLLFLAIEAVRGRSIKRSFETAIHNLGFILLLVIIVAVTYQDALRFGGSLFNSIKNWWPL
jgi:regulator of sigma E protease